MQNKFKKKKPNTISMAVYYAASGLRATVAAGDREYANIHKVYTVWLCAEDVVFRNGMNTAFILSVFRISRSLHSGKWC